VVFLRYFYRVNHCKYFMKIVFTMLLCGVVFCATAQTDTLRAGVYSEGKTQLLADVEKREILSGKTHDLDLFRIYTLSIKPGAVYIPSKRDVETEQLIIVKEGSLTLMLNDSTKTVGPGSLALVLAGDKILITNKSTAPASWFVLNFVSKNPVNIQRGQSDGPSFIKDWSDMHATKTAVGEARPVFNRTTSMFEKFDVHATALNPGMASHPPHTHRVEELILMLQGSLQEQIAQDKFMAYAGDCIFLTSGILHGPKNISNEQCYYYAIQWHNLKTD
jgi:(S)-ureidoglycine aminohydrolase